MHKINKSLHQPCEILQKPTKVNRKEDGKCRRTYVHLSNVLRKLA